MNKSLLKAMLALVFTVSLGSLLVAGSADVTALGTLRDANSLASLNSAIGSLDFSARDMVLGAETLKKAALMVITDKASILILQEKKADKPNFIANVDTAIADIKRVVEAKFDAAAAEHLEEQLKQYSSVSKMQILYHFAYRVKTAAQEFYPQAADVFGSAITSIRGAGEAILTMVRGSSLTEDPSIADELLR